MERNRKLNKIAVLTVFQTSINQISKKTPENVSFSFCKNDPADKLSSFSAEREESPLTTFQVLSEGCWEARPVPRVLLSCYFQCSTCLDGWVPACLPERCTHI